MTQIETLQDIARSDNLYLGDIIFQKINYLELTYIKLNISAIENYGS